MDQIFSVCVASIVRIYYMTFLANSVDITWIMGDVFIWSSVEPCIGILCACLPTLKPLLRYAMNHISSSNGSKNTDSSNTVSGKGSSRREGMGRRRKMPLDWDEAQLTTHAVQIQMQDTKKHDTDDDGITIEREFRMEEENHLR